LNSLLEAIASEPLDEDGPHLITVDELRAAGALDVPKAWRKSLGDDRGLFGESLDDDDVSAPDQRHQHRVDSKPDDPQG
jgi:hypothetical protein